jgi:hypothetical protein
VRIFSDPPHDARPGTYRQGTARAGGNPGSVSFPFAMHPRLRIALGVTALLAAPAGATTVRSLDVGELATRAELVFEGRVLARETRTGARGALRTCVSFEVLEIVKGPPVATPYELCFAGGASGSREVRVEGMRYPEAGERGIYFVGAVRGGRTNPLLGWDQGRFLVAEGPDPIVTTAEGAPVVGLGRDRSPPAGPSDGVARGARLARPGERPLTPAAFKARIREIAAGAP